jgi:dihydroxyacid dehydratase/phosphogluconate dehydratase
VLLQNLPSEGSDRETMQLDGELEQTDKHTYWAGRVVVIRNKGSAGGPGMRGMLATTVAFSWQGISNKVAPINHVCFSGSTQVHRRQMVAPSP